MAYAIDIINNTFELTKKLLFPIKKKYWFKMGLVSLLSSKNSFGGNSGSGFNRSDLPEDLSSINISEINSKALDALKKYGIFIGIGISLLFLIGLFFSYITSIFTFIFIDGVVNKKIEIKKSLKKTKSIGTSLFLFKLILGLLNLAIIITIFSPLILSFLNNNLKQFKFLLLIPMTLIFILVQIFFGIVNFLVYDFLVLIMFYKNKPVKPAWKYFKKIASKKKLEIFLYWLMKIVLGIGAGIFSVFVVLFLMLGFLIIAAIIFGIGFLIYILVKSLLLFLIVLGVIMGIILFFAFIYFAAVFTLPVKVFFQYYAILMIEKLEKGK
jgi:hypothetical protein